MSGRQPSTQATVAPPSGTAVPRIPPKASPEADPQASLLDRMTHDAPHVGGTTGVHSDRGARVTGRSWVASPFLRAGALSVAVLMFVVILGYSALRDGEEDARRAESFFAVYLTDDPLPAGLEGLHVTLRHVWAGCGADRVSLALQVQEFELSAFEGPDEALLVAWGHKVPKDKQEAVCIDFERAKGIRGTEEVPIDVPESQLAVEYSGRRGTDDHAAAVLLDIDLARSVVEVVQPDGQVALSLLPTVSEIRVTPIEAPTATAAGSSGLADASPPGDLFVKAAPQPSFYQYRAAPSATLALDATSDAAKIDPTGALSPDAPALAWSTGTSARATPTDHVKATDGAPSSTAATASAGPSSSSATAVSSPGSASAATTTSTSPALSSTGQTSSPPPTTSSAPPSSSTSASNQPPNAPSAPSPSTGSSGHPLSFTLAWTGGDPDAGNTVTYYVYLDTANPPQTSTAKCIGTGTSCSTGTLNAGTAYHWRVYAFDGNGASTLGSVWSFTTDTAPNQPAGPSPIHGASGQATSLRLSWNGGDPDAGQTVWYSVQAVAGTSSATFVCNTTDSFCDVSGLAEGTPYSWKVVASDGILASTGPTWAFQTACGKLEVGKTCL